MIGETRDLFWGYKITSAGLIVNLNGTFRTQYVNNKGYYYVSLRAPWGAFVPFYVHRLVAHVFVHNPRTDIFKLVDHIDRDSTNNVFSNLRWLNHALNNLNNDAKGCYYHKKYNKWRAKLCGKNIGWFKTYEAGHAHYVKCRDALFFETYHKLCHERVERDVSTRGPSYISSSETTDHSPIPCC